MGEPASFGTGLVEHRRDLSERVELVGRHRAAHGHLLIDTRSDSPEAVAGEFGDIAQGASLLAELLDRLARRVAVAWPDGRSQVPTIVRPPSPG